MSLRTFGQRTFAARTFNARTWNGAGSAIVAQPVDTRRGVLRGATKLIGTLDGCPQTIGVTRGASLIIGTLTATETQ